LGTASPLFLKQILTTIIRQDRFVDGTIASAFEDGWLGWIVARAAVLADDPED
jgi:hypothetical protein